MERLRAIFPKIIVKNWGPRKTCFVGLGHGAELYKLQHLIVVY